MGVSPKDGEFAALLVHRGQLTRDEAQRAIRRSSAEGVSFEEAAVREGFFTEAEAARLRRTRGGEKPEIPGYEIGERVGAGGTGEVFRGRETESGREVALKVLRDELAADPVARARFVAEARMLIALDHENIVRGYRLAKVAAPMPRLRRLKGEGETRDVYFFAMEFVAGPNVLALLESRGPFPEEDALFVVLQTAKALEYMRSKGIVHRDVKPGNLLIGPGNKVKLIDLGLASSEGRKATGGDTTSGTAHYLSPEQARGEELDVRSDIYSLGATLYHLAVGSLPFEGSADEELVRKQVLESLSSEALKGRRISPHLHYFLEKMMAKEKEIRYQSPADLIADIETQIAGRETLRFETAREGGKTRIRPRGDLLRGEGRG